MKRNARTRRVCRGFTLFETLVVIALLAIAATLTVPSFVAWRVRDQVDARARALLSTLSYARGEALRRGARVTVCRIDAARRCLAAGQPCKTGVIDWSCGWTVMIERGGGFYPLRAQPDLAPVSIVGALTNLTFTPPASQANAAFPASISGRVSNRQRRRARTGDAASASRRVGGRVSSMARAERRHDARLSCLAARSELA